MTYQTRGFLLVGGFIFAGVIAFGVIVFGVMVEPEDFDVTSIGFALALGAVYAMPFWLSAILTPNNNGLLSAGIRWIFALIMLSLISKFAGILRNFFSLLFWGQGASLEGLIVGLLLNGTCLLGFYALIWPELSELWSVLRQKKAK